MIELAKAKRRWTEEKKECEACTPGNTEVSSFNAPLSAPIRAVWLPSDPFHCGFRFLAFSGENVQAKNSQHCNLSVNMGDHVSLVAVRQRKVRNE